MRKLIVMLTPLVLVSSTGAEIFDYRNPDLQPNVDQSWIADPNADITQEASNHATLVAGVMVAARNRAMNDGVFGMRRVA